MSGADAFRQLKALRPDLKVVLSSGYNEIEVIQRIQGQHPAGFIQKPYTAGRLAEKIKGILEPPSA